LLISIELQKGRGGEYFIVLESEMNSKALKGNHAVETAVEENRPSDMSTHTGRAATKTRKVERILAPTDFSSSSQAGVRYALDAARELGAEVIVYHVITAKEIAAFGRVHRERALVDGRFYGVIETYKLQLRRLVEKILADVGDVGKGIRVREKVQFGTPERNILRAAAAEKADLIVMSTRRKGRWARLFSSDVTEHVSRYALCPVITVPSEFSADTHEGVYKKAA
jgi:universal stress protein A